MPKQPPTPTRSIRLPDDLWASLTRIATQAGISTSEAARLALAEFIRRHS